MLHDVKPIPMSPQKGKARENKNWQANWWDLYPLAERSLKPLEWSQSSIIFCAHPTQPLITARHFSSSKQFVISSPPQVVAAPTSYGPPTLISVAPGDDWLFAYFPGHGAEGVNCLWTRGLQIDNWTVKESWSIAQGAGPVTASWLGQPREWVSGTTHGSTTRLPPRGPHLPVSSLALLLVTQDHNINLCYYRQYFPTIKFVTCSILHPAMTAEGQVSSKDSPPVVKQCFRAAIGLGYNEDSFLIATRSHSVPLPLNITSQYGAVGHELQQGVIIPPSNSELHSLEWENLGEDATIQVSEVQVLFNGIQFGLHVEPLSSLLGCDKSLVSLYFVPLLPSREVSYPPPSPRKSQERLLFYLVSSYLDFDNYESVPRSELVAHRVTRIQSLSVPNSPPKHAWKIQQNATRSFAQSVIAFSSPPSVQPHSDQPVILAGILNTSGTIEPTSMSIKKSPIGSMKFLNLSDLADHVEHETSPILSEVSHITQDIPLKAVLSPNGAMVCTISSSQWPMRTLVHSLPRLRNSFDASGNRIFPLAASLASAIIADRCSVDITHSLSLPSTPFGDMVETLLQADNILDDGSSGFSHPSTVRMLGAVIATYKQRAITVKSSSEDMASRWKTAHDVCSLVSCNEAFEDCSEGNIYDLDAVWQLTGLCAWVISLAEDVLKVCVLSRNLRPDDVKSHVNEKTFAPPLNAPALLHIAHPFVLDQLVTALSHVHKFCTYTGSLTARGESAQLARDIVVDIVSNSGIELPGLINSLDRTRQNVSSLDRESCRRALISCQPTPDMHMSLSETINTITQPSIITKLTLFIKPHDLVDVVGNLPSAPKKDKCKDVVSKNILAGVATSMVCLQCGGKTALAENITKRGTVSSPWRAWERKWMMRCICGGRWKSDGTM